MTDIKEDGLVVIGQSIHPNINITSRGVQFLGHVPIDKWATVLPILGKSKRLIAAWIGDTMNYGEREYGDMVYQYMDSLGLSENYVANLQSIYKKFPYSRRREGFLTVSISSLDALAGIENEDARFTLLDIVIDEQPTRDEVRDAAREIKMIESGEEPDIIIDVPVSKDDVYYKAIEIARARRAGKAELAEQSLLDLDNMYEELLNNDIKLS